MTDEHIYCLQCKIVSFLLPYEWFVGDLILDEL